MPEICHRKSEGKHKILTILIWGWSQSLPKNSTEKETFLPQNSDMLITGCKMYREDWIMRQSPFVLLTQENPCHIGMRETALAPKRASLCLNITLPARPLLKKSESSSQFNTDESEAKEHVSGLHSLINTTMRQHEGSFIWCAVQARLPMVSSQCSQ